MIRFNGTLFCLQRSRFSYCLLSQSTTPVPFEAFPYIIHDPPLGLKYRQSDRDYQGSLLLSLLVMKWSYSFQRGPELFYILFTYTLEHFLQAYRTLFFRGSQYRQVDRHNQGSLLFSLLIKQWSSSFYRGLDLFLIFFTYILSFGAFPLSSKEPPLRGDPVQTDRER